MPHTAPDVHVHLALHPQHASAVVATLTGRPLHTAHATLATERFQPVTDTTMLLARIDHAELHYASTAAVLLRDAGITVHVTEQLREVIHHPGTRLNQAEIRLASNKAQKIHDDIQSRQLTIHLHAYDGRTTVTVGVSDADRDGPAAPAAAAKKGVTVVCGRQTPTLVSLPPLTFLGSGWLRCTGVCRRGAQWVSGPVNERTVSSPRSAGDLNLLSDRHTPPVRDVALPDVDADSTNRTQSHDRTTTAPPPHHRAAASQQFCPGTRPRRLWEAALSRAGRR
ncbi:hypothetical protein GPA10_37585 [Streptomyces sp. p1417]|uniref:Uncharacterized protein n=1 Tax=Streptomyces typhae TaxID=2681492 RepID=A0A6L6X8R0_9ACTN|nr:hypothetical protein [Streptomyces typhae]MVO90313.1 hypothetical protein [Streptomyces typhae]